MQTTLCVLALGATLAGAALAHSNVRNAAVKLRMDSMEDIGAAMKTLGDMARGKRGFDADAANGALGIVARESARMPDLFRAPETDPTSEALPAIWQDFARFEARAQDMQTTAAALQGTIRDTGDLSPALQRLGGACKACHTDFRE